MMSNIKFKWYTNGIINKKIFDNDEIPVGFIPGFILLEKTKRAKLHEKQVKNNRRELTQRQLKKLPISERRSEKDRIQALVEIEKSDKKICKAFLFEEKAKNIKKHLNKSVSTIYQKLKFYNLSDDHILNQCLFDLITEKYLIHQLENMPIYIDTIVSSLKELYAKNIQLQHKKNINEYFLNSLKNSQYVSDFYKNSLIQFL